MTATAQTLVTDPAVDERCPVPDHCVLRVDGLEKTFHRGLPLRRRRIDVLTGASLMVCSGELVGLVGENGSGKSTLMPAADDRRQDEVSRVQIPYRGTS